MDGADYLGEPVGLACAAPSFSARSPASFCFARQSWSSGRGVDGSAAPTVAVETIDPDMVGPGQPTDEEDEAVGEPADEPAAAELPAGATGAADAAAAQPGALPPHRMPPRRPLSPLGQAAQPDPDGKAEWDGTTLYPAGGDRGRHHRGERLYRFACRHDRSWRRTRRAATAAPTGLAGSCPHRVPSSAARPRGDLCAAPMGEAKQPDRRRMPDRHREPRGSGWSRMAGRGLPVADPMPRPGDKARARAARASSDRRRARSE